MLDITGKTAKNRVLCVLEDLGVFHVRFIYAWLIVGKRVWSTSKLIETFSPAFTVEALWADIGRNCGVRRGWVTLCAKFREMGGGPITTVGVRKLESWPITWRWICDPTFSRLIQYRRVTDRYSHAQTHRHTTTANISARIASAARVKWGRAIDI